VALWYEDGELRLVSELLAGWYRYISDWRLRDDGTIRPRSGSLARAIRAPVYGTNTTCIGASILMSRAQVVTSSSSRDCSFLELPYWLSIVRETRRKRSPLVRRWRVVDRHTHRGYRVTPGITDGSADAYGVADVWCLRYHGDELDDGVSVIGGSAADMQIQLSKYINGESIDGTDVVLWYAGHFLHDQNLLSPHQGHIVGPELRPVNW
jgi:hypothetical protein